ncbi:MAG: porin [Paraburkholderia sp.]|uniref:porin n=1 Tax=Paraburkholderia sp. TaxID=1926495 RepID=UPI0011FBB6A7|nr:porin [Paraburkholderia sp.]TAL95177.1 MAG: porin [Paraburkholderia sp.]
MKKCLMFAGVLGLAAVAHAQGSVTLYGVIDTGFNYVNNDGGKSSASLTSCGIQCSAWGLKGSEDLGGGLKAVFKLENGFDATTGALQQGGREFGRQAWVGLSDSKFGTIRLGRQYDFMFDYLQPLGSVWDTGQAHPFDNDNVDDFTRFSNVVKYISNDYAGFEFGGMYGFSNQPSSGGGTGFGNNRAWSAGVKYQNGPVNLAATYLHMNNPGINSTGSATGYGFVGLPTPYGTVNSVSRHDTFGIAGTYAIGNGRVGLMYTHTNLTASVVSSTDKIKFDNFELTGNYYITPALLVSGSYMFTMSSDDNTGRKPKYNQVQAGVDYFLSKRTDLYVYGVYQRVNADAGSAWVFTWNNPSTTRSQVLARAAIRHTF